MGGADAGAGLLQERKTGQAGTPAQRASEADASCAAKARLAPAREARAPREAAAAGARAGPSNSHGRGVECACRVSPRADTGVASGVGAPVSPFGIGGVDGVVGDSVTVDVNELRLAAERAAVMAPGDTSLGRAEPGITRTASRGTARAVQRARCCCWTPLHKRTPVRDALAPGILPRPAVRTSWLCVRRAPEDFRGVCEERELVARVTFEYWYQ